MKTDLQPGDLVYYEVDVRLVWDPRHALEVRQSSEVPARVVRSTPTRVVIRLGWWDDDWRYEGKRPRAVRADRLHLWARAGEY